MTRAILAFVVFAASLPGQVAYVVNRNDGHCPGFVSGYTVNITTGALTLFPGPSFPADAAPVSMAVDPSGRFAYVTNSNGGNVSAYTVNASNGILTAVPGSPFASGTSPRCVAADPTGKFVYVSNFFSNNVSGYTIDSTTGALTDIPGSPFPAEPAPSFTGCVVVHPSGKFAYVTNRQSPTGSVSGYTIDATTGALTPISGSPFAASGDGTLGLA